jgi:nicotinate dehydrogenase subunit B
LPQALLANPALDDWIRVDVAQTIRVRTGKVELGQGILTALALIAAEELDVALERIRIETADSARPPHEFMTVGSMSIETSGAALRLAAAHARMRLLERAAGLYALRPAELRVSDGTILTPDGRSTDYWQLFGGRRFECTVDGSAPPKHSSQHRIVGRRAQRIDIADKVFGERRFVNDLQRPDMLHARVVRSANPRAKLQAVELAPVQAMPGVVHVLRDGSFLGVLAEREEQALRAAERLRELARFDDPHGLPEPARVHELLREELVGSFPLQQGVPVAQPLPPLAAPNGALTTLRATYTRPYLMHASIAPSAALARYSAGKLEVHSATQGVDFLAATIAQILGLAPADVRVIHCEGAGCYGHNGNDDAALDAALLARAVPERFVLLKWSRSDEHACEPYGSPMRIDVQASLDAAGRVIGYSHDVYSCTHIGRAFPGTRSCALLAGQQLSAAWPAPAPRPFLLPEAGLHRNAWPAYEFPEPRVIKHLARGIGPRTSSLRSLGAYGNVFAIESMMDELAACAGRDPVAFRLAHLNDPRARAVIEAGAERARFSEPKSAASEQCPRGRGMGFARYENHKAYAAVFVELEVDLSRFAIRLLRAVIAADAGQIIDPDGLENQLEGGFVQAASWTLKEAVRFDTQRITSLDWASYPILGFEEVPPVEVVLIDRPDQPSRGAGEATQGPTPAAIANAVFDACGIRLRDTPFTSERVRAALLG